MAERSFSVFVGGKKAAAGTQDVVEPLVRGLLARSGADPVLVFDDITGEQVDLDLRPRGGSALEGPPPDLGDGHSAASAGAQAGRGPGRPKLGVVGREVTLLPRHWEWLNAQPGGASVTLRKLVERARREGAGADRVRRSQEATYRFMSALAGNAPGFEEACRALFAQRRGTFEEHTDSWPGDVRDYARGLAGPAFGNGEEDQACSVASRPR